MVIVSKTLSSAEACLSIYGLIEIYFEIKKQLITTYILFSRIKSSPADAPLFFKYSMEFDLFYFMGKFYVFSIGIRAINVL